MKTMAVITVIAMMMTAVMMMAFMMVKHPSAIHYLTTLSQTNQGIYPENPERVAGVLPTR